MPMKLKEKIYHSMNTMDTQELWLLYEQIQLMQHLKQSKPSSSTTVSIEDILTMTSSSAGAWSDAVKEERMERI